MANDKHYQIVNLVANGGTATLYKAIQTSLDRVVAVKKLHDHLTGDENFTRRFILEAKAAASLDHDNIVKIIDFGVEEGSYQMVMEFIEGESLRDVLDHWKQIPEPLALAIAHHTCQGLEHAHNKGIIHRDIKPGNIMLTHTGRVKITDFGLAKLTQAPTQHTAANSILGTPLYMSPEQAFGESVDHRSDLFSLGTMLYECLTGHQPFIDDNYMSVIQNIINQNVPHPSRFGVELSPGVETILLKLMNKSRDARFQNAGDLKRAIERHLGLEALQSASEGLKSLLVTDGATMVLPRTERSRRTRRRLRKGLTAVLFAASLAGAAAVGFVIAPDTIRCYIDEVRAFTNQAPMEQTPVQQGDLFSASLTNGYAEPVLPDSGAPGRAVPSNDENTADTVATLAQEMTTSTGPASTQTDSPPDTNVSASPSLDLTATADETQTQDPTTRGEPVKAVKTGWLSVRTEPPAEIYVDGRYVGDAPATRVELTNGSHTLECRSPRFETYRETLNITAGELSTRNIVLEALVGRISLSTIDGAEVYVDGILVGVTPIEGPFELDPGRHQLTVKKTGYHVWNNVVTLEEKQLLPLRITLSPIY